MPHAWVTNSSLSFPHVTQLRTREEEPIVMNLQRQSFSSTVLVDICELAVPRMLGYEVPLPWRDRLKGRKWIKYDMMWLFVSLILLSGSSADRSL